MLFRDLLLAVPGLLGPIAAQPRTNDADILRQIVAGSETPSQSWDAEEEENEAEAEDIATEDGITDEPQSYDIPEESGGPVPLAGRTLDTDAESRISIYSDPAPLTFSTAQDDGFLSIWAASDTPDTGTRISLSADPLATETLSEEMIGGQSSVVSEGTDSTRLPAADIPAVIPANAAAGDIPAVITAQATTGDIPAATARPAPQVEQPVTTASALPGKVVNLSAEAGRVAVFDTDGAGEIASVRILAQGQHGHASVNPDNSLSLVLSESPGSTKDIQFRYEITYADGRTQEVLARVDVTKGQQKEGWGQGEFYMLEEGQDGRVTVEHGDNHRKVYITAGDHGLTKAEIARAEGIKADKITGKWLADHPEYGASADKALDYSLGYELWNTINGRKNEPASNWLLIERGYEYTDLARLVPRGASGESALQPLYIGAYGEGHAPVIGGKISIFQNQSQHVVIQGLDARAGIMALLGDNLLLDNLQLSNEPANLQNVSHLTLNDLTIVDVVKAIPSNMSKGWQGLPDRVSGAYISGADGLLLQGLVVDRNGWSEGYAQNLSGRNPQAPSMYSHNLYLQFNNLDVTVRDSILMRGASYGMQLRSGGVIEDVVAIDNNAALATLGGNYADKGYIGNYSLWLDNLITSAGHKRVDKHQGALSIGLEGGGAQTSLIGNIVAHLADPANAAEIASKTITHTSLKTNPSLFYNDTIIYKWAATAKALAAKPNQNVDGLDAAVLDETTIQNFTAQLLGRQSATIADLADYLRAQADGKLDHIVDADLIIAFFREGFGLSTDLRADAETLRFIPDERGDGMRWDNRLNWSSGDLPGTQDGDSVDLGGNRVLFGAKTVTVDDFIFRDYGQLKVSSGRLDIEGEISTGAANKMQITNAGQVWIDGYRDSDSFVINVTGGRFANTGEFAGRTALSVSDQGQAILASSKGSFDLTRDSTLSVTGTKARVGFDAADGGAAVLRLHDGATVRFATDGTGFGKIGEFRSGAFGETSSVTSGVVLDGRLSVDLKGFKERAAGSWTLIDADQIIGRFDDISISGLSKKRDALIRIDYVRDEVILVLGAEGKGSGQVRTSTTGDANFITHTQDSALKDLWDHLHGDAPLMVSDPL